MSCFDPTASDLTAAITFRHNLHRRPELSGHEAETASTIAREMRLAGAGAVMTGLGGHGVAASFGTGPERRVMIRAELDALPIAEDSGVAHASETYGVAHSCGHDGHMATLVALAHALGRRPPVKGCAILLFQPAEEDGQGAAALLRDPRMTSLAPDLVVALHNLPGLPMGQVSLAEGPMGCASRGMRIRLTGRTAHASQPEAGLSPRPALARLLRELPELASDAPFPDDDFALVTIARVAMGGEAFGISPGEAEIRATLRCLHDVRMERLVARAEAVATNAARAGGLSCQIDWHEVFAASVNHPDAVAPLRAVMDDLGLTHSTDGQPWRPSEDFGLLGKLAPAAMFFLGSGQDQPPLHDPGFDYPDALIGRGAAIFARLLEREFQST